jgi:hypothetical protein
MKNALDSLAKIGENTVEQVHSLAEQSNYDTFYHINFCCVGVMYSGD